MKKIKWSEMTEFIALAAIILGAIIVLSSFVASGLQIITPEQAVVMCPIGAIFMIVVPIICVHKH